MAPCDEERDYRSERALTPNERLIWGLAEEFLCQFAVKKKSIDSPAVLKSPLLMGIPRPPGRKITTIVCRSAKCLDSILRTGLTKIAVALSERQKCERACRLKMPMVMSENGSKESRREWMSRICHRNLICLRGCHLQRDNSPQDIGGNLGVAAFEAKGVTLGKPISPDPSEPNVDVTGWHIAPIPSSAIAGEVHRWFHSYRMHSPS